MYYLLGFISAIGIVSVFAYSYTAGDVGFTPLEEGWDVDNVQDALDSFRDIASECTFGCEIKPGEVVFTSDYTGEESIFVPECTGNYKLEVWGAQGGSYNSTYFGGYGGYSTGIIFVTDLNPFYINVGEAGIGGIPGPTKINETYNGGGGSTSHSDSNEKRASGGGATHIAYASGELFRLSDTASTNVIIVAGGGGGAQVNSAILSTAYSYGGHGGGYIGGSATGKTPNGTGGTQLAGGEGDSWGSAGSFGKGGFGSNSSGGGGGWYGGSSGARSGGAGGSGFIASGRLKSLVSVEKHMTCYSCTTSDDTETKTRTTTDVSLEAEPDQAKKGDGYAKITLVMVTQ